MQLIAARQALVIIRFSIHAEALRGSGVRRDGTGEIGRQDETDTLEYQIHEGRDGEKIHLRGPSYLWIYSSKNALGGTRTPNLLIRSQMLYPIELRAQSCLYGRYKTRTCDLHDVNVAL
jgi:hypothetical protein